MAQLAEQVLMFKCDFDERTATEVEQKGWFEQAVVRFRDGTQVPVFFYDPVRLSQDLDMGMRSGKSCLAEPAMIVLPRITREFMESAVQQLHNEGFFERLLALRK